MGKFGKLVPFRFLRLFYIRSLMSVLQFRRKQSGTFQITCLTHLDSIVSYKFATAAVLGIGQVKDRVIAVNGRPEVHPTAILTCTTDHKCWNGMRVVKFLTELDKVFTSDNLEALMDGPS